MLVGLEIPLLLRILRGRSTSRSWWPRCSPSTTSARWRRRSCFPLLLVPQLGLVRTSLLFGPGQRRGRPVVDLALPARSAPAVGPLPRARGGRPADPDRGLAYADRITALPRTAVRRRRRPRPDDAVPAHRAHARNDDFQLFLNGNLQFSLARRVPLPRGAGASRPGRARRRRAGCWSSAAATAWPCARSCATGRAAGDPRRPRPGDDAAGRREPAAGRTLNARRAARSAGARRQRGRVRLADGAARDLFDVVVVDFPDPHNFSLGKLYTRSFYRPCCAAPGPGRRGGGADHVAAVRAPVVLVHHRDDGGGGLPRAPYHALVPSFGEWGFVLAARRRAGRRRRRTRRACASSTVEATPALFVFPPDMAAVPVEVNRLDNQILVRYYEDQF